MHRRDFIRLSSLASASLAIPDLFRLGSRLLGQSVSKRKLIVIQLTGGNDGLNTFIPFEDNQYYRSRGRLAIAKKDLLQASGQMGFHPALEGLKSIYEQGWMTILQSVGYPEPNLSHFRSMDIWHTGSSARDYLSTGWLGRWLDQHEGVPHEAIQVDNALSLALKGQRRQGFALRNPESLRRAAKSPFLDAVTTHGHDYKEEMASYLYQTLVSTQESAAWLVEKSRTHSSKVVYPQTQLGKDLKTIAELLTADTDAQIYYASLTGFDTHVNQLNRQERLLRQYGDAVKALVTDLKQNNQLKDTLILTFSEFGRRVDANGSGGTDHGTANSLWMINEGYLTQPGFANAAPDLANLDAGNLIHTIDFRSVYAALLQDWLGVVPGLILGNDCPPAHPLIRSA